MIIDFHTHVFPDKIATKTIDSLAKLSNTTPYTDGTTNGLISSLEKSKVDIAVALPVLTKPTQFDSVLNFAISLNERYANNDRKIISFAGIHPDCDDIYGKMKLVKDSGIKGVKIHPDYQDTFIDDDKFIKILKCAKDLDLIVVTHSGVDDGYLDKPIKCPPDLAKKTIEKVGHKKFVLGHYGAHKQWQEVLGLLSDLDVYFDTALAPKKIDKELFNLILNRHGADRVLFATDSPWGDVNEDILLIKDMVNDKRALDNIFYKNACKLLDIGE